MAGFLARVELHGAGPLEYEELHINLALKGLRNSWSLGGVNYKLPPATYFGVCAGKNFNTVYEDVLAAAHDAGFDPDTNDTPDTEGTPGTCAVAVVEVGSVKQAGLKRL